MIHRLSCIILILVVTGLAGITAAEPPRHQPMPDVWTATMAFIRLWHARLMAMPHWSGLALFLASGLPLFFGWTLIRLCSALILAAIAALVSWELLAPRVDVGVLWAITASAAVMTAVTGWFLYQILIALKGGALVGLLFFVLARHFLPPSLQAPWDQVVLGAAAFAGLAMGAVVGWRVAPWVAIVETTLVGTLLAVAGVIALAKPGGDTQTLLVAAVTALAVLPAGLYVQARRENSAWPRRRMPAPPCVSCRGWDPPGPRPWRASA